MKGKNAQKIGLRGKEWWSKRPLSGYRVSSRAGVNKFFKRLFHKIERRIGRSQIIEN